MNRNLRDAFLTVFGVISVVNGAFGNGHLLIALLGAVAAASGVATVAVREPLRVDLLPRRG